VVGSSQPLFFFSHPPKQYVIKFLESISEIYLFISEIKLEQDAISGWGYKAINDCGIKYKTFFSYYCYL
jgi:hypothetical protein